MAKSMRVCVEVSTFISENYSPFEMCKSNKVNTRNLCIPEIGGKLTPFAESKLQMSNVIKEQQVKLFLRF